MLELLGLFGASFVAATLFPLPSEAALFGYLQLHPEDRVLAVAVATVGNTAPAGDCGGIFAKSAGSASFATNVHGPVSAGPLNHRPDSST